MSDTTLIAERPSETERVHDWRVLQLIRAGYDIDNAERIGRSSADLHVACKLLVNCPEEIAVQILC